MDLTPENLRLAIYGDGATARDLLWQSPPLRNNASGAWVAVPVAAGTPSSLTLTPGYYYLAWQLAAMTRAPSYSVGFSGDGFYVPMNYGRFPDQLVSVDDMTSWTTTTERWSAYVTYSPPPTASRAWPSYK